MIRSEEAALTWLKQLPQADAVALERLERLVALLREENQRQNLVSAASLDQVWQRHIVDSAQLLTYVTSGASPWIDLGTGAGFPGLVIAVLQPHSEVIMIESRARRIEWLERARTELGLDAARVVGERLEQVPSFGAMVISARAFAPLERLLVLAERFSTSDTKWLLPKGKSAVQELHDIRKRRHAFHVEQSLTDPDAGIIVGTLVSTKGTST